MIFLNVKLQKLLYSLDSNTAAELEILLIYSLPPEGQCVRKTCDTDIIF